MRYSNIARALRAFGWLFIAGGALLVAMALFAADRLPPWLHPIICIFVGLGGALQGVQLFALAAIMNLLRDIRHNTRSPLL
jgi:cytochrome bd-type quinol oxidase subunit 1